MPRHPHISQAAQGLSSRVYTSLVGLAQTHAPEVFALNVGDTYLLPPVCARSESQRCEDLPGLHSYAEVRGEPRLLTAIADDLERRGRPVAREHIQVTAGATNGIDLICRTLLSAGDQVIVLAPYWPLIRGLVSSQGAVAVEVPFFTEIRRPGFDLERAIAKAISERTVAVYVNSPHNPTGVVLRDEEIDAIARLCVKHDLWLISDEAYDSLSYRQHTPAVWTHAALRERAWVAHTASKRFGIAGARVGFVHGPSDSFDALSGLWTYTTYCASKPMQLALARTLEGAEGLTWNMNARSLYEEAAHKTARALGLETPESGTFVCFDTTRFLRPSETPSAFLERLAKAGVVLTPGSSIGRDYAHWARLCFTCVAPDVLDRALAVLKREIAL